MNIAELRMVARKANEMKLAQAEVKPNVIEVGPVATPKVETKVEDNYVVVDEKKEETVEVKKSTLKVIINRVMGKKEEPKVVVKPVVKEKPKVVVKPVVKEEPKVDTKRVLKKIEERKAEVEMKIVRCIGCKNEFKVALDAEMIKTGRCPSCMEAVKDQPVKTIDSLYGTKITKKEEVQNTDEVPPVKKGLKKAGGRKLKSGFAQMPEGELVDRVM